MASTLDEGTTDTSWTLVVAMANNGVIGRGNTLPWHLRSDLQRFKQMTMGHCLLMGRKTYESIGRPLPGRQTIVLTRSMKDPEVPHLNLARQLDDVPALVQAGRKVMVVGGAELYRTALGRCQTIWLTRVLADIQGDTVFPELDWEAWDLQSAEEIDAGPQDDWQTRFEIWKRKSNIARVQQDP